MSVYSNRPDVSSWAVHFVRDRNPQDAPGRTEDEYEYWTERDPLEPDAPALVVLLQIVKVGGLKPGYSFRRGETTVYGGEPVVCFTEMPIYCLTRYVADRGDGTRVQPYGVAMLKHELFDAGARPVIYGTSRPPSGLRVAGPCVRILPESVLPLHEQYRYVAYDPLRAPYPMDWTHEREWRWRASTRDHSHQLFFPLQWGGDFEPGLPLFRSRQDGGFFSKLVLLVANRQEASDLADQLQCCADAGTNNYAEPYCHEVLAETVILSMEDVVSGVESGRNPFAYRIEDLDASLLIRPVAPAVSQATRLLVEDALCAAADAALAASTEYLHSPGRWAGCGGAWLVTYDAQTEVTRALLDLGRAHSLAGEFYSVSLKFATDPSGAMERAYWEHAMRAAASVLSQKTGQSFYVHAYSD